MALKSWLRGVSGNFADARNWSGGAPGSGDQAAIQAAGDYTVTLDTAQTLGALIVQGAGTHLTETAAGSLSVSQMVVSDGAVATLGGAAQISDLQVVDGVVRVNSAGAHFDQIDFYGPSAFVAGANLTMGSITLGSPADYFDGVQSVAAANGRTLTINSSILPSLDGAVLQFGAKGAAGTVVFDPAQVTRHFDIAVAYGLTRIGSDGAQALSYVGVSVGKGATLDLAGVDTELHLSDFLNSKGRPSDGTITNSIGLETLDFYGTFKGQLTGDMNVNFADGAVLGGAVSITGDATVLGGLTLTGAGTIGAAFALTGADSTQASLRYAGSGSLTLTGAITGSGGGIGNYGAGTLTLTHANSFTGGSQLFGGTTVIGNGAALGSGQVSVNHGALIASADLTLGADVQVMRSATFGAAAGHAMTLAGAFNGYDFFTQVVFGRADARGTVVDAFDKFGVYVESVVVAFGTFAFSGVAGSDYLTANTGSVTVKSGAQIDLAGADVTITHLRGAGSVVSSGGGTADLTLNGGNFDGVIAGDVAVEVGTGSSILGPAGGVTFTGAQAYTGGTTIQSGFALTLGAGGKSGSVTGAIANDGVLFIDRSNAITLAGAITGAGSLVQEGAGTTTLSGVNTYAGGTTVQAGTLSVTSGAALGGGYVAIEAGAVLSAAGSAPLGNGHVEISGGELLERATATVGDSILILQGGGTIAASHGTTLTLTGYFEDDYGPSVTFGDANGHDGKIVFAPNADPEIAEAFHIAAGILQFGSAGAAALFADSVSLTVDSGATLDLNGYSVGPYGPNTLSGAGVLTNTSATAAELTIYQNLQAPTASSTFDGAISGKLTLDVENNLTLTGAGSFTNAVIEAGAILTLGGAAAETVTFAGAGGELVLGAAAHLTGVVSGFGPGDEIDLQGVSLAGATHTYNGNTHLLTVKDGTHTVSLTLDGVHANRDFALTDDGTGHVLVTDIATAAGPDFVV